MKNLISLQQTTSPLFQKSAFSVLRRYSDFLWLYETLSNNNPGVVVPPVPEKSPFGRFDDQFVKQRRVALEKCIQKTANHPVLGKDADLRLFLESDSFALDVCALILLRNIAHKFSRSSIGKRSLRMKEVASLPALDSRSPDHGSTRPTTYAYLCAFYTLINNLLKWFDRQKIYLDSLESQLRGLAKAIELVAKHRAGTLALCLSSFCSKVLVISKKFPLPQENLPKMSAICRLLTLANNLPNL